MPKNMIGKLAMIILLIVMAGLFVYFYVTLNRVDKQLVTVQTTLTRDSAKVTEIVNFFNTNLNASDKNANQ